MKSENRSKRHAKRQNDIIEVNIKNKTATNIEHYVYRSEFLTLDVIECVAGQLGYHPLNIVNAVLKTDENNKIITVNEIENYPLVAVLYPLNHNKEVGGRYSSNEGPKPFPTTFWMTCPDLHTRISKLEDLGYINKFQLKLLNDEKSEIWLKNMHNAHKSYREFRWSLLSNEDKMLVETSGWAYNLRDVGIAGIRDFDRVKCLHCHYAHHLGRPQDGNLIGQWVDELLKNNIDETEKKIHEKNDTKNASMLKKVSDNNNEDNDKIEKRINNEVIQKDDEMRDGNIIETDENGVGEKREIKIKSTPTKKNPENDCCHRIVDVNVGSYTCDEEVDDIKKAEFVHKSKNEIEVDSIIDSINSNNTNSNNTDDGASFVHEQMHVVVDDDTYESSWNCFYLSKTNKENKRISCVIS